MQLQKQQDAAVIHRVIQPTTVEFEVYRTLVCRTVCVGKRRETE